MSGGDPVSTFFVSCRKEFIVEKSKKWYQSKAIYSGIATVIVATWNALSSEFGVAPIPEFVFGLLGVFGIYGRATATTTIKPLTEK